MKAFENYLLKEGLKHSSTRNLIDSVKRFESWLNCTHLEVSEVNYTDVLAYLKTLREQGLQQNSIAAQMNGIRHYFNYLIDENKAESNPTTKVELKGVKKEKAIHILNPIDLEKLYADYAPDSEILDVVTQRNLVILGLLVFQGLTIKDLKELTIQDVKIRAGLIFIPETATSNERELELKPVQLLDLQTYLNTARAQIVRCNKLTTDKLLVASNPVQGVKAIDNMVFKLMKELKRRFPNVLNLHQIRASVITRWVQVTNLRQAQYRSGHRYISSTEKYQKNDLEGLKEALGRFFPGE